MISTDRQHQLVYSISLLKQKFSSQIHKYRTRSVSSDSFYFKFSRTDKMYAFFSRIGAQMWNSIPYPIKLLKRLSFRKKIKELLINFLRSEDEYVEVSHLIKLFKSECQQRSNKSRQTLKNRFRSNFVVW